MDSSARCAAWRIVPPGRLVDTARLHADVPVLHQVDAADAVLAADPVEPLEQRHRTEPLAVDGHRVAGLELDLDMGREVGRLLGRPGQEEHLVRRLGPGVLEDPALVGDVEEVPVHRVRPGRSGRDRDPVALGVGHEVRRASGGPSRARVPRCGDPGRAPRRSARTAPGRSPCRSRRGRRRPPPRRGPPPPAPSRSAAGRRMCPGGIRPRRSRWRAARGTRSRGRTPRGDRRCGPSSPRSGAPSLGRGSAPRPGRGPPCRRRSRRRTSPSARPG